VLGTKAAHLGLFRGLEEQDFMDNWNARLNLDLRQRLANRLANMLRVGGLPPQYDPQTNYP
jgi:hypothetical protein